MHFSLCVEYFVVWSILFRKSWEECQGGSKVVRGNVSPQDQGTGGSCIYMYMQYVYNNL